MLYQLYELQHALLTPARWQAEIAHNVLQNPNNPFAHTPLGRKIGAAAEMFERSTRRFGKPFFDLTETHIGGKTVAVEEHCVLDKPFCKLLHFRRDTNRHDPRVLIVAPMSGHFATLLRGTVKALLPHHDIYITDWKDARMIPLNKGHFNLDDYITYVREFLTYLGVDTHIVAVCQPAVPVLAAVSLMASDKDVNQPLSMTLMGGPIDTRISKTSVTELAENRSLEWFEHSVTYAVPAYYPGAFRKVYPGFLQLGGFMSMNLDRHVGSHMKFYQHLIEGDGESANKHREFYDEYLSVMDLPAEFYLQTVETVFQKHSLPRGLMKWKNHATGACDMVDPSDIKRTALLTIEGELDDISAHGQTTAAHGLCTGLAASKQFHHFQENCGHYGIFNGSRWKNEIMPRLRHFIRAHESSKISPIPAHDLKIIPDIAPEVYDESKHGIEAVRKKYGNPLTP